MRRLKIHRLTVVSIFYRLVLLMMLAGLTACSSKWKAPMSSVEGYSKPGRSNISTARSSFKKGDIYRVVGGDTLYSIAWKTGIDFRQLAGWNRIKSPYKIYPGQKLVTKAPSRKVATKASGTASKQQTTSQIKPSQQQVYSNNRNLKWQWPASGKLIQAFQRNVDTKKGIRIAGVSGRKIVAAESGKVVYSGSGLIGYGRLIIIKHNNKYLSAYGHNRKILVKKGDHVTKGKQIATMGLSDGQAVLHFEIRKNGKPVNPVALLPRR